MNARQNAESKLQAFVELQPRLNNHASLRSLSTRNPPLSNFKTEQMPLSPLMLTKKELRKSVLHSQDMMPVATD